MKCPEIVLNAIKYIAFGICILYVIDSSKSTNYYLQKGIMIGGGMVVIEYIIKNICRDVRENFTTGPNGLSNEEDNLESKIEEVPIVPMAPKEIKIDKELLDESSNIEKEIMEEDMTIENENIDDEKQVIEYGYSFVHPSAMKLPEVRIQKCLQDNPCNVCPVMMGGTADLMQVKPTKKPVECDQNM